MKKVWLALAGMILAFSASAARSPTASSTSPLISRLLASRRCSILLILLPALLSV